jgi:hypothetical protein
MPMVGSVGPNPRPFTAARAFWRLGLPRSGGSGRADGRFGEGVQSGRIPREEEPMAKVHRPACRPEGGGCGGLQPTSERSEGETRGRGGRRAVACPPGGRRKREGLEGQAGNGPRPRRSAGKAKRPATWNAAEAHATVLATVAASKTTRSASTPREHPGQGSPCRNRSPARYSEGTFLRAFSIL